MKHSYRIEQLIQAVPPSASVVDVGCDHGFVALGLAARNDIQQVLATDISAASLQKLRVVLPALPPAMRAKITTCVADGLVGLPWEKADAVVIAGMGGSLLCRILAAPQVRGVWKRAQLILLPHNDTDVVRRFLTEQRFIIAEEQVFFDGGHYYELLCARPLAPGETGPVYTPAEWQYGIQPIRRRDPALRAHLTQKVKTYRAILQNLPESSGRAQVRRQHLVQELDAARRLLSAMEPMDFLS
uniref:tRNA (adenine(22)-N(1))-methyltransferase n=1 Tax=Ndongobacter massiliensis TaxID=1871025 RepID=UPI000931AB24|nr:class I SAM-dependent methyltransferase [Ndongobacter massiliensis]